MEYEKTYVAVELRVDANGKLRPLALEWEEGQRFEVARVVDIRIQPPSYVGGVLTELYDCIIEGARKQLWRETDTGRWFVERRK